METLLWDKASQKLPLIQIKLIFIEQSEFNVHNFFFGF